VTVQQTYDQLWSKHWGDLQAHGPVHRHIRRIIVETVRSLGVRSIVDVGCGNGLNLDAVQSELGITDLTGIDISETAIGDARTRVNGEFLAVDVISGVLPERKYDLVLSSQVIEHVDDDEAFVDRLYRLCDQYCFVGTMQGRMRASEVHIGHLRNYTKAGLVGMMEARGFKILKVIEWGFPFYSPVYRTAIEWVGGNTRTAGGSRFDQFVAGLLFHLYRLNAATHGDVIMILASVDKQGQTLAV
jgi:SAM-dependent methyltransferase